MEIWHILPVDDIEEHDESERCHCNPSIQYEEGGRMIVHNSFDGREIFEYCQDNQN